MPDHEYFAHEYKGTFLMNRRVSKNNTSRDIVLHMIIAAVSLFVNGFGVYLTIHANIGAGPWDVLNIGISKTFGILYGTASIVVSLSILGIDILLKEAVGVAMIIDALVVGKAVDFFQYIKIIPQPHTMPESLLTMFCGLVIMGYTQYFYMNAALGCGPRDTLLVGLKRRVKRVPIGVVSIALLGTATLIGYLLGGPVGIGTIICAFITGPIMQFAFRTVRFDPTAVSHQRILASGHIIMAEIKDGKNHI